MKLLKTITAFIALVSLQIAAAQWLNVPPTVEARMMMVVGGGVPVVASFCDDCSGDLKFSAHFENSDTITTGTPCGCVDSSGDTTWTLTATDPSYSATAQDGSYSLYSDGGSGKFATLTVASNDIVASNEGKITFYVRLAEDFDSGGEPTHFVYIENVAASDYISIRGYRIGGTANEIEIKYDRNGEGGSNAITSGANLQLDTWYLVTALWKYNGTPNTLSINANTVTATSSTGLPAWAAGPDLLKLFQAKVAQEAPQRNAYIDNLKIYATSGL